MPRKKVLSVIFIALILFICLAGCCENLMRNFEDLSTAVSDQLDDWADFFQFQR